MRRHLAPYALVILLAVFAGTVTAGTGHIDMVVRDILTELGIITSSGAYSGIDGSLTANQVAVASDANTIAGDADFTFNPTTDALALGGPFTATLGATEQVIADARTTPHTDPEAVLEVSVTAGATNVRGVRIRADANSQANTEALEIEYIATGIAAGEIVAAIEINADTADASGGVFEAVRVDKIGSGAALVVEAIHAGPGVVVFHQDSGAKVDPTYVWLYDDSGSSFTDATVAFGSTGLNVQLWAEDDDIVFVGMAAAFDAIEFGFATAASGGGIAPTFAYSTVAGGTVASAFGPLDSTDGARQSGVVDWEASDLASWGAATVNGTSAFWVGITRTRNTLSTPPTEDFVKAETATEYTWDENGDLVVRALALASGLVSAPAITMGDPNTGIFGQAGNFFYLCANGSVVAQIGTTGVIIPDGVRVEVYDNGRITFGTGIDRFIQGEASALTDNTATEVCSLTSANLDAGGVVLTYTIYVVDSGTIQAETGVVTVQTLDVSTGVVASIGEVSQQEDDSSGGGATLTTDWAVDTTDDQSLEITCDADSSLASPTLTITWTANVSGDVTLTVP